jgi:hypothetical protein
VRLAVKNDLSKDFAASKNSDLVNVATVVKLMVAACSEQVRAQLRQAVCDLLACLAQCQVLSWGQWNQELFEAYGVDMRGYKNIHVVPHPCHYAFPLFYRRVFGTQQVCDFLDSTYQGFLRIVYKNPDLVFTFHADVKAKKPAALQLVRCRPANPLHSPFCVSCTTSIP